MRGCEKDQGQFLYFHSEGGERGSDAKQMKKGSHQYRYTGLDLHGRFALAGLGTAPLCRLAGITRFIIDGIMGAFSAVLLEDGRRIDGRAMHHLQDNSGNKRAVRS